MTNEITFIAWLNTAVLMAALVIMFFMAGQLEEHEKRIGDFEQQPCGDSD